MTYHGIIASIPNGALSNCTCVHCDCMCIFDIFEVTSIIVEVSFCALSCKGLPVSYCVLSEFWIYVCCRLLLTLAVAHPSTEIGRPSFWEPQEGWSADFQLSQWDG